jgi:hypothetical protein
LSVSSSTQFGAALLACLNEAGELPARHTHQQITAAVKELLPKLSNNAQEALQETVDWMLEYVCTRPSQLVIHWRQELIQQVSAILEAGLLKDPQECVSQLRIACTPAAERGALLPLLAAGIYSLNSALDRWETDKDAATREQALQRVEEALELWEQPVSNMKRVMPASNAALWLSKIKELLHKPDSVEEQAHYDQSRETVKALLDLCIYEHRWLRWSVPHRLVPTPQREVEKSRRAAGARHGGDETALGILQASHDLTYCTQAELAQRVRDLRADYFKVLTFIMPDRPPALVLHYRDKLPPPEMLLEFHTIQYLSKVGAQAHGEGRGLLLVDSMEWVLARLKDAKGSLWVLIDEETRSVARAELTLSDEQSFPQGVQRVLRELDPEMLDAAVQDQDGHVELLFIDLEISDPRDRKNIRRPGQDNTRILRKAELDFGLAEAALGSPMCVVGICRVHPKPNASIKPLLERSRARDSGKRVQVGEEIYAILVSAGPFENPSAASPD